MFFLVVNFGLFIAFDDILKLTKVTTSARIMVEFFSVARSINRNARQHDSVVLASLRYLFKQTETIGQMCSTTAWHGCFSLAGDFTLIVLNKRKLNNKREINS